jgi:hypothetical protein
MFSPLGSKAYTFEDYNMTLNNHEYGISPSKFDTDATLGKFW